ncbi:ThiF family adenylyltransferase [uncultured Deinococcus sp.]|uniref:ThiF family adenylyltransferase n=1 Tax=uncultured Deinococcus sp. TaxID=158789 RepID=UPI00260076AC|nr:ThiF family adenylyltransferase [uncultured Deinococcus sp.]
MSAAVSLHTLAFEAPMLADLRAGFERSAPLESAAFVLARAVPTPAGAWRLIVQEVIPVADDEYAERTETMLTLPPAVVARAVSQARARNLSVILAHAHPDGLGLEPSARDLAGEAELRPFLARRIPAVPHGRLILGPHGAHARLFLPDGSDVDLLVAGVGSDLTFFSSVSTLTDERHDRQVRAFGQAGQQVLAAMRVAVVGLGGTGSLVAQQLAHLGVREYLLIDPDILEATNLNRVVGARAEDIGRPKVEIARALILAVQPEAHIEIYTEDVCDAVVARRLLDSTFFFSCTDSHGSRAVLTQLAYQYRLPGIDLGVAIHAEAGRVDRVAGRVQMLVPGLPCLNCAGVLLPEEVRRDLLTPEARRADPYIVGAAEPQPAVISLNSVTAALAVNMFLAAVTGMPLAGRHLRVRFEHSQMKPVDVMPQPYCPVCGPHGAQGRADSWVRPGRVQTKVPA